QQVTNPVPALGGVSAELRDDARRNAPLHVQNLQRIVTLNDYKHFVQIFAGISKVQVKRLWNGRRQLIYITVAGEPGQQVAKDALLEAINAAVATPSQPVSVDVFEPLYFQLDAALVIEAAYAAVAETVLAQVTDALTTA